MTTKADEPAFPGLQTFEKFDDDLGKYVEYQLPAGGLSKREMISAMAMSGIISGLFSSQGNLKKLKAAATAENRNLIEEISDLSCKQADALLLELERRDKGGEA